MKHRFLTIIYLALLSGITFLACSDEKVVPENPGVDLVNGIEPVDQRLHFRSSDLAAMPAEQRAAAIEKSRPFLHQGVIHFLRQKNRLGQDTKIDSVQFLFGSSKKIYGEDKTGKRHRGYFNDQLVAKIYSHDGQSPQYVIVECLNGIYELPEDFEKNLQALGTNQVVEDFTIGKREGLLHYVDWPVALEISRKCSNQGVKLYKGKIITQKYEITPEEALALIDETDWTQITARVFTGDRFIVKGDDIRYIPAHRPQAVKNKTKNEHHKRRR